MHFFSKLQSMTLETFRSNSWWLVVGDGGMVVGGCVKTHFSDQLIPKSSCCKTKKVRVNSGHFSSCLESCNPRSHEPKFSKGRPHPPPHSTPMAVKESGMPCEVGLIEQGS